MKLRELVTGMYIRHRHSKNRAVVHSLSGNVVNLWHDGGVVGAIPTLKLLSEWEAIKECNYLLVALETEHLCVKQSLVTGRSVKIANLGPLLDGYPHKVVDFVLDGNIEGVKFIWSKKWIGFATFSSWHMQREAAETAKLHPKHAYIADTLPVDFIPLLWKHLNTKYLKLEGFYDAP